MGKYPTTVCSHGRRSRSELSLCNSWQNVETHTLIICGGIHAFVLHESLEAFSFPQCPSIFFHLAAIAGNLECSASRLFFQTAAFSYVAAESSLEAAAIDKVVSYLFRGCRTFCPLSRPLWQVTNLYLG